MSPSKRRPAAAPAPEPRVLTDPRAIRALAHPARLAVLEELTQRGELTATDCAAVAGLSASAMSYHLRALAKWGFVERAPASGDGRERPWRATAKGWRIDEMPDEGSSAAADTILGTIFDRRRKEFADWNQHERTQPPEWRNAALVNTATVWVTAAEAADLLAAQAALLEALQGRGAEDHPAGARRVRVSHLVVPLEYE